VIPGSSGSADGFQVVRTRSPGVIDMFPALIYASVKWRDGIIDAKTRLQPAQQKTKYLRRNTYGEGAVGRMTLTLPSPTRLHLAVRFFAALQDVLS
jgi:hypothetical protein